MVTAQTRNEMIKTRGTNERKGGKPQAKDNQSKLIQANKTLKKRDRVLAAAIRKCHFELARKKGLRDIEASKDAVEAAWNKFNHATASYCARAGENLSTHPHRCFGYFEEEEQPEEARRALYEWKVLTDMMEQVVDKAEEYLESATKENSWGKLYDKDFNEDSYVTMYDAEHEIRLWMNEVNMRNEVNMNEESGVVCDIKEVAPVVEIVAEVQEEQGGAEVQEEQNGTKMKFDVITDAMMGSGVKEVMQLDGLTMMKTKEQSRCANWDPGEVVNAKEQIEMLDVEEVAILVKDDNKVGLRLFNKVEVMQRGDVTTKVLLSAMMLCNFVRLYISEMLVLVALSVARFVIVNPMSSRAFAESFLPILSDYG